MHPFLRNSWLWIAGVIAIAVFVTSVVELALMERANSRLDVLRAAVLADGKTSMNDFLPPPVPDEQNALPVYRQALETVWPSSLADEGLDEDVLKDAVIAYLDDPAACTAEQESAFAAAEARMAALRLLLVEARDRPYCQLPRPEGGDETIIDIYSADVPAIEIRELTTLLIAHGRRAARKGELEQALADFEDACRLLSDFNEWPIRLMLIARKIPVSSVTDLGADLLQADDLRIEHVRRMQDALVLLEEGASLRDAITLERLGWLRLFENGVGDWRLPSPEYRLRSRNIGFLLWRSTHYWKEDLSTGLQCFQDTLDKLDRPLWTRMGEPEAPPVIPRAMSTYVSSTFEVTQLAASHAEEMAIARSDARLRMLAIACHLVEGHLLSRAFPETAAGISGDWTDPFTGRPFEYKRTADGFSLRCAAEDGRLDTGDRERENDIVLRIARR